MNAFSLPFDIVLTLTLFVLAFLYGYARGKEKILSAVLAFYPSILLFQLFPYWNAKVFEKQGVHMFVAYLGVFLLFYIPTHLIFSRFIQTYYGESMSKKILQLTLLAGSFTLLCLCLLVGYLPVMYSITFGVYITKYLFWLFTAPILAILISIKE